MLLLPQPEDSDPLIGRLDHFHLPHTKAGYLEAMFTPGNPELPLEADVVAQIPDYLPGRLPTSVLDMLRLTRVRAPRSPQPSAQPAPPATVRWPASVPAAPSPATVSAPWLIPRI